MVTNQSSESSTKIRKDSDNLRRIRSTIDIQDKRGFGLKLEKKFSFLPHELQFQRKEKNSNEKLSEQTLSSQDTDEVYKKIDFDQKDGIALNVRDEIDTFISKPEKEFKNIFSNQKEHQDFTENSSSEKSSEIIDSKERLEKDPGQKY